MLETNYAVIIKNLFQEYYKRNISMGEYRAQRSKVLNQMDEELNGARDAAQQKPRPDDRFS